MYTNVGYYIVNAVGKHAEKIAVKDQNISLTFEDVYKYAVCIGEMIREVTNKINRPIVILADKCARVVPVMMGIIFSGNYYVPLDVKMPSERLKLIIETVDPQLIIVDDSGEKKSSQYVNDEARIHMDGLFFSDRKITHEFSLDVRVTDSDPAYMLFTSGSTGIPKGVVVPHRAVIDYIEWQKKYMPIDENSIMANQAPFYFDASMPDVFTPFAVGARLVIIPEYYFMTISKLIDFLRAEKVNTLIWVPSALVTVSLSECFKNKHIDSLKLVMFCGEIMPNKVLNNWRREYDKTTFVNLYGPTEAAYACTYYVVDRLFEDSDILPIGKALENTKVYVIKEDNSLALQGEEGELCIGGSCLALGYYKDAKKTKESFIINPFNEVWDEKIYRTGDIVKYNDKRELEYIGRKDFQIKHMGYRIELGEIESAAYNIEEVERGCAIYDKSQKRIVLFCICKPRIGEKEIYNALRKRLPLYMLPSLIIIKESFPHTANGKIDRDALMRSV